MTLCWLEKSFAGFLLESHSIGGGWSGKLQMALLTCLAAGAGGWAEAFVVLCVTSQPPAGTVWSQGSSRTSRSCNSSLSSPNSWTSCISTSLTPIGQSQPLAAQTQEGMKTDSTCGWGGAEELMAWTQGQQMKPHWPQKCCSLPQLILPSANVFLE
jgi:hypothetical protein